MAICGSCLFLVLRDAHLDRGSRCRLHVSAENATVIALLGSHGLQVVDPHVELLCWLVDRSCAREYIK